MTLACFSGVSTLSDPWGLALDQAPARVLKVLDAAEEHGWQLGRTGTTMVARFYRPDHEGLPFFARWDLLVVDKETGKRSWRFHGAMAANGQRLTYNDIFIYLKDPDVIWPDPPEG